jgi:segregation and condensation protein B
VEETWELKPKIEALLIASDRPATIQALAQCLNVGEDEVDAALQEFEADLLAADRGIQLRRRPHGVRIETKPQYADLIGRLLPERKAKPITSQALETLAIVALKQPVSTGDINAIRGIESAGTVQTLRNRKLIARSPRLGPRRERIWRTTQLFLDTFGLASLDELYKEGRMEEVFASVYIAEMVAEAGKAHSNNGAAGDVEAS